MREKRIETCQRCGGELYASACGDCMIAEFAAFQAKRKIERAQKRAIFNGIRSRERGIA